MKYLNYKYLTLKRETTLTVEEVVQQALSRFHCTVADREYKGTAMDFILQYVTGGTHEQIMDLDSASVRHLRKCLNDQLLMFTQSFPYTLRQIKTSKSGMAISFWLTQKAGT